MPTGVRVMARGAALQRAPASQGSPSGSPQAAALSTENGSVVRLQGGGIRLSPQF